MTKTFWTVFAIVVSVIAVIAVSFVFAAGLWYLVCWSFGIAWSWNVSVGVWCALALISSAVKSNIKKD